MGNSTGPREARDAGCSPDRHLDGYASARGASSGTGCVCALRNGCSLPSVAAFPTQPLTAEEFSSAKAALEKLLEKGQLLNLKAEVRERRRVRGCVEPPFLIFSDIAQVNPEIIGGLVFDIGDKHLDLSLNTRIRKVEQMLSQSVQ